MRVRLTFAVLAAVAALGVLVWALAPGSTTASARVSARASISARSASPKTNSPEAPSPSPSPSQSTLTAGMHLAFNADFSGPRLDKSVWDTCYPWAKQRLGCTNFGNSDEHEWYMPSQVHVSGGDLQLVAQKIPTPGYTEAGAPEEYSCRSGMVTTHPGFNFEYGYVQVVAHIPAATGLWPALWLAASNLEWPPEIDMLEHWGLGKSAMFFHPVGANQVAYRIPASIPVTAGWHTFGLDWTPTRITWYLDGTQMMSVTQDIPHQDMYFIADLAEYQKNSPCTGTLQIASVKVWQP